MEQKQPFKERRKYVRLEASVEVHYTVIGQPGAIEAFSKNISAGGLCITAKEEIVSETPLQIQIRIPDLKDPIRALARVVWQKKREAAVEGSETGYDTGIEFTGISDFDRFNINRYVLNHTEPGR
jgi:c-di-GMP-binding flagellar brake protein YcgR